MAGVLGDVSAIAKDLHARFDARLSAPRELLWPKICRKVDSDGAYEKYAQVTRVPFPRVWKEQRVPHGVDVTNALNLTNNTYELTIDMDEDLVADAKAYELQDFIDEAADRARAFPDKLLASVIEAGATAGSVGVDGGTFYNTTASFANLGVNTFSNKLTGTGTSVTQIATDLAAAIAAMKNMKDNQGGLINQSLEEGKGQLLIQCPPALEFVFRQVLNTSWIPVTANAPGENVFKGIADLFADGFLTDANDWYLHYVGQPTKPFVFQERRPLRTKLFLPTENASLNAVKTVRIAVDYRFRIGYMFNYRSVKTSNS